MAVKEITVYVVVKKSVHSKEFGIVCKKNS